MTRIKWCKHVPGILVSLLFLWQSIDVVGQNACCEFIPFDDRGFHLATAADIYGKRLEIIRTIWGTDRIPDRSDISVIPGIASPLSPNPIVSRVDRFRIPVAHTDAISDLAYFFVPAQRNNRLVLFCPGHICKLKDEGNPSHRIEATIIGLLSAGFDVLSVFMPHISEDTCDLDHCRIFYTDLGYDNPPMTYGLRLFLDPTLVSLNYLLKLNNYRDVNMVGLSGGGWTTNLVAALDERVRLSFSVAGSMPVYYRHDGSIGDIEQFVPGLYRDIAGYPDLYVLGAFGEGRKQVQILNRNDDCCFGIRQHDPDRNYDQDCNSFEQSVKEKLNDLGARDHYDLVIDKEAPNHQISSFALLGIILPCLLNE